MPHRAAARFRLTALLLVSAPPLGAQSPAPAIVRVHVASSSGDPIVGADVAILNDRQETALLVATTDRNGNHDFAFTPDSARYRIAVRKLGFVGTVRRLLVQRSDTLHLDLRLISTDSVRTLPTVVARESYRIADDPGYWEGFDDRCRTPNVSCTTGDSLDTHPNDPAHYFNRLPGIIPGQSQAGAPALPIMYGSVGSTCKPSVFINGFLVDPPDTAWHEVMNFSLSDLKGVEVYATGQPRPARFRGDPLCGSIVLWLK